MGGVKSESMKRVEELIIFFKRKLELDLIRDSQSRIDHLTNIVKENVAYGPFLFDAIDENFSEVLKKRGLKLPTVFLIDSIVRNVSQYYTDPVIDALISLFCGVFYKVDTVTKQEMYHRRKAWNNVLSPIKLHKLDRSIAAIDPGWPVSPLPAGTPYPVEAQLCVAMPPSMAVQPSVPREVKNSIIQHDSSQRVPFEPVMPSPQVPAVTASSVCPTKPVANIAQLRDPRFPKQTEAIAQTHRTELSSSASELLPPSVAANNPYSSRSYVSQTSTPGKVAVAEKPEKKYKENRRNSETSRKKSARLSSPKESCRTKSAETVVDVYTKQVTPEILAKLDRNVDLRTVLLNKRRSNVANTNESPSKKMKAEIFKKSEDVDLHQLHQPQPPATLTQLVPPTLSVLPPAVQIAIFNDPMTTSTTIPQKPTPTHTLTTSSTQVSSVKPTSQKPTAKSASSKTASQKPTSVKHSSPERLPPKRTPVKCSSPEPVPPKPTSVKRLHPEPVSSKPVTVKHSSPEPVSLKPMPAKRLFPESASSELTPVKDSSPEPVSLKLTPAEHSLAASASPKSIPDNLLSPKPSSPKCLSPKPVSPRKESSFLKEYPHRCGNYEKFREWRDRTKSTYKIPKRKVTSGQVLGNQNASSIDASVQDPPPLEMKPTKQEVTDIFVPMETETVPDLDLVKTEITSLIIPSLVHSPVLPLSQPFQPKGAKEPAQGHEPSNVSLLSQPLQPSEAAQTHQSSFASSMPDHEENPTSKRPDVPSNRRRQHPFPRLTKELLDSWEQEKMISTFVNDVQRDVRFYGQTAITFLEDGYPHELRYHGKIKVKFNKKTWISLKFNTTAVDFKLNGKPHKIRLGAPTRELYIDDKPFMLGFNLKPTPILLDGKEWMVQLLGREPTLTIFSEKRTDLVAGKINLVIDGDTFVPIYLDYKPQRFDIDGEPFVLQFKNRLTEVHINGKGFETDFGGKPTPKFRNFNHSLQLSELPKGIVPGEVHLHGMEDLETENPHLPDNVPLSTPATQVSVPNITAPTPTDSIHKPAHSTKLKADTVTYRHQTSFYNEQRNQHNGLGQSRFDRLQRPGPYRQNQYDQRSQPYFNNRNQNQNYQNRHPYRRR